MWTVKHCERFFYYHYHRRSLLKGMGGTCVAAVKGVTYNNLIWLGMLWGKGPGAYKRGLFGQSWGCHGAEWMGRLHDVACKKLEEELFGPYDVLNLLIGEKNARKFCRKERINLLCRPPTTTRVADSRFDGPRYLDSSGIRMLSPPSSLCRADSGCIDLMTEFRGGVLHSGGFYFRGPSRIAGPDIRGGTCFVSPLGHDPCFGQMEVENEARMYRLI